MTTYNTGNPIGSFDTRDRADNTQNLDLLVNGTAQSYADRLGVSRKSWKGFEVDFASFLASSGFELPALEYVDGTPLVVARPTQLIDRDGILYSVKPTESFPATLTGTWVTDQTRVVVRTDQDLRQDLADVTGDPEKGAGIPTFNDAVEYVEGSVGAALRLQAADISDLEASVAGLVTDYIHPYDPEFGAVGNGVADDSAELLACLSDGRPVNLGGDDKVYRITEELAFTALRSVVIHSDGARILVDSPASIRTALRIDLAGKNLYTSGRIEIACQNKSYSGFYATNFGAAVPKVDALIAGMVVTDCHRTGTTFTGGDGIYVGGNMHIVRIADSRVSNVHMAAGAGVSGVQGVTGITVARDSVNGLDSSLTYVSGCNIGPVYSDDVAYIADQDGLRVFTDYASAGITPRPTYVSVDSCRFINCHGRAIKLQCEFASVDNIKIERDTAIYSNFFGNPDIDFQTAGGQASNIQCHYSGNYPSRVFQATLTRDDTRLNPTSLEVSKVIVVQQGTGTGIARFAAVSTEFDAQCLINLSGIAIHGAKDTENFLTIQSQVIGGWFGVNMDGIMGRTSGNFVARVGVINTPCFVTGKSIINTGVSRVFCATGTGVTISLIGANRLVT